MAWLPAMLKGDEDDRYLWINADYLADVYDGHPYVEAYFMESEYCYLIKREHWLTYIGAVGVKENANQVAISELRELVEDMENISASSESEKNILWTCQAMINDLIEMSEDKE